MFGSFGWMELLLILFIVLIIFGAGKIPQLGEGLGKAIKGFKKAVHEPEPIEATATPVPDQPHQPTPIAPIPVSSVGPAEPVAAQAAPQHQKQG
ncbi:MAG: twin-arginine translocase TatA/TatE family subunit [Nitrospiraceae bacterium]|nr:twin-arginine translocase TatA/TatE family subunit [Nitrospiraceae bacterium]